MFQWLWHQRKAILVELESSYIRLLALSLCCHLDLHGALDVFDFRVIHLQRVIETMIKVGRDLEVDGGVLGKASRLFNSPGAGKGRRYT
jgi:hypothetical protein